MEAYTNNIYKSGFDSTLSKPLTATSISPPSALDAVYNDGFNSDFQLEDLALSGQKVGGTLQVGGAGAGAGTMDVLDPNGNPVVIVDQNGMHLIGSAAIDFNAPDPFFPPGTKFPYDPLATLVMGSKSGGLIISGVLGIPMTIFGGAGLNLGTQAGDMLFQQPGTGPGGFHSFRFQSGSGTFTDLFTIDAVTGLLGTNTTSASGHPTPATVQAKMQINDTAGNPIGFIPIYNPL